MRSKMKLMALAVLLLTTGIALAQDRLAKELYIKLGVTSGNVAATSDESIINSNSYQWDVDEADSVGYEIGVGITLLGSLRTELSYAQDSYSYDLQFGFTGFPYLPGETDVDTTMIMVDVNWEFLTIGPVRPYIGVGIGQAWHEVEDVEYPLNPTWLTEGDKNTEFTWRINVGVAVKLTDGLIIDLCYSWIDAGVAKTGTYFQGASTLMSEPVEIEMKSERLMASIRFVF